MKGACMAKIKISDELLKKIKQYAKTAGYSSEEEFIVHAIEKELSRLEHDESGEDIKKKLQGLGYIS